MRDLYFEFLTYYISKFIRDEVPAKTGHGSMHFAGARVYDYNTHIATIFKSKNAQIHYLALSNRAFHFSNTTSRHTSRLIRAAQRSGNFLPHTLFSTEIDSTPQNAFLGACTVAENKVSDILTKISERWTACRTRHLEGALLEYEKIKTRMMLEFGDDIVQKIPEPKFAYLCSTLWPIRALTKIAPEALIYPPSKQVKTYIKLNFGSTNNEQPRHD